MKKALLTLTALSMSVFVSACASHDNSANTTTPMRYNGMDHGNWNHEDHRMMAQNLFDAMDKNGDGVVTRKEFKEFTHEWFREADRNHDGNLTFEEFKAQLKREKEKLKSEHMQRDGSDNDDNVYDRNINDATVSGDTYRSNNAADGDNGTTNNHYNAPNRY